MSTTTFSKIAQNNCVYCKINTAYDLVLSRVHIGAKSAEKYYH